MLLRASIVAPLSQPPVADGAVRILKDRILSVGPWKDLRNACNDPAADLGRTVLMPGLVNAHCHLDLTHLAGKTAPGSGSFTGWIHSLMAARKEWAFSDYAASWITGAKMLVQNGVTTAANIESVSECVPDLWSATPLRVRSFLELTCVLGKREPADVLHEALAKIECAGAGTSRPGLSPHAPYSVTPALLELTAAAAMEKGLATTIHIAESEEERDMFMRRRGPMFDWLKTRRDMSDCGAGSPVELLERHGLLRSRPLAVHANYLAPGDPGLLARRNVSVAHCPRSHAFFGHAAFPFKKLAAAGVNVCLGTDSLASVQSVCRQNLSLDMFAEMALFARRHPAVPPETIVRMATVNGARALNMAGRIGELSAGAFADLIAVPFSGKPETIWETVVHHSEPVSAAMIGGKWVHPER